MKTLNFEEMEVVQGGSCGLGACALAAMGGLIGCAIFLYVCYE